MTTITPPIAPQPLPAAPGTPPVVVVPSPPPALARLAIGQLLTATITTQVAKDVFQVQTPMGQLSLQSGMALPKGGTLVLQLQSQSPFVQFQINSLNGAAPPLSAKSGKAATPSSQSQGAGTVLPNTSASAQGAAASGAKLAAGNVLQATLMRPLSQPTVGGALQTPAGLTSPTTAATGITAGKGDPGQLAGKPASANVKPAAPSTGATAPIRASGRTVGGAINPTSAKSTPGVASPASGYLPTGSQLSVKITGVQLPSPVASNPTPSLGPSGATTQGLPAGTSLSGTVTGSTPSGHPIVQTKAGVFALTTQTVVPRGSVVTLDVVSAPTAPVVKPGAAPSLHESLFTSRKWPALEEIIQVVQEANPATAQQLIHSVVPRPNVALSAGVLFFLTALRGGDMSSWIGNDVLRMIEKTRPNLVGRVTEDFTSLARMADEPATGDWRVALIPINTGADIEQIRLLLRQHGNDEDDEEDGKSDTRFVIDVELSKFGRIQLDGLSREKGKSLDLIVRSQSPLSDTMRNDIRTIFTEAAELTGLKGGVKFQAAPPDFIDIPDPSGNHDLGLVV